MKKTKRRMKMIKEKKNQNHNLISNHSSKTNMLKVICINFPLVKKSSEADFVAIDNTSEIKG